MIAVRILFALGTLAALALLALIGTDLARGLPLGSRGTEILILLVAAGILAGGRALARRGRPVLACLLLLVVVLPGLLAAVGFLYLSLVGFGPHH